MPSYPHTSHFAERQPFSPIHHPSKPTVCSGEFRRRPRWRLPSLSLSLSFKFSTFALDIAFSCCFIVHTDSLLSMFSSSLSLSLSDPICECSPYLMCCLVLNELGCSICCVAAVRLLFIFFFHAAVYLLLGIFVDAAVGLLCSVLTVFLNSALGWHLASVVTWQIFGFPTWFVTFRSCPSKSHFRWVDVPCRQSLLSPQLALRPLAYNQVVSKSSHPIVFQQSQAFW